jgi:hypothetical protein
MVAPLGSIAALFAIATAGCSIVTTTGGPDYPAPPPAPAPDCTTSKLMVYVDSTISVSAVATSLFIGLAALANSDRRTELGYATLFTFLGSIPFAVSGIVGGVRVNSCRKAHEQYRMMMQPQPQPYGPPSPYGPAPYPAPYPQPAPYPPPAPSGPPGGP